MTGKINKIYVSHKYSYNVSDIEDFNTVLCTYADIIADRW